MQVKALKWLSVAAIAATVFMAGTAAAQVTTFAQLQSAIAGVPATNVETVVEIGAGFGVDATVRVPANKKVKLTGAGGGTAYTLSRGTGFKGSFFVVETGGQLTVENLTLDGGRSGGSTKNRALVRAAGAFIAGNGAVLKNNDGCAAGVDCPAVITQYTVSFNTDGGTPATIDPVPVNSGGTLGLDFPSPDPVKAGYTFGGWFDGATRYYATTAITGNVTLVASWTANTYTVTVSGGGTGASGSGSYAAGVSVNITAGTRADYTFSGWTSSPSVTFANASNATTTFTMPSSAVTVTANWTAVGDPSEGTFTDSRDGKSYGYVTIGSQTWMAENLNYAGTDGSLGSCYNNSADSCAKYGRLYNWSTVMNGSPSSSSNPSNVQGICPAGWHVPSDAEWTQLTDFVGSNAGTRLKSSTGWQPYSGVPIGTDEYGFSALPGGGGYSGGGFYDAGYDGYWWGATERDASHAWYRYMFCNIENVSRNTYDKADLFSARCLRD